MIWYILIATFLFFGYFSKKPKIYYNYSLFLLFIFTGFRDTYLGDYYNVPYMNAFERTKDIFHFSMEGEYFEVGFMIINSICKTLVNDFRFFQVIYTLLVLILLHFVIKKLKFSDREKNLFLFVYFTMRFVINNFIILRQNIANLIIWNLLFSGSSLIICLLFVYFSTYFHASSVMNYMTTILYKFITSWTPKKIYFATIIVSVVMLNFSGGTIEQIISLFIDISSDKYQMYLSGGEFERGINWIYYALRVGFFTMFFIFYKNLKIENKKIIFVVSAIAIIFGSINAEIFSRSMEYFMIGIYVIMTYSYRFFKKESQGAFLFCFYFVLMVIMIRQLLMYGGGYLTDYSFFW